MENENRDILSYQLEVAKEFGLKEAEADFLSKIKDWKTREWYLICIIDGMPLEDLLILAKAAADIDKVKKARIENWSKKVSKTDRLNQTVLKLKDEVSDVCKESQEIKKVISENIEQAFKQQSKAQEDIIKSKEEMILMLEQKVKSLEEERGKERLYRNSVQVRDDASSQPSGIRGWFFNVRKAGDTGKFIRTYLKDEKYSVEQKEFLIECIEEGIQIKDIEVLASPNLSVSTMKRLKEMILKYNK
ncbi:hypothetical protein M2454_000787 [Aequitasia blattaphilus]|uniref:Uncharacterized protein n=1 Tax=Aequitasia blattaphilus TaxID=2949332 RepID=A0ABT1E8N9_9FIRM|nr:hypothetical protein [Aequitasia blattaphilus]MCP1101994.1 hypothetical protein [Aequitasia blattaphilus]MCR8614634.1 hypothetical protein [Aequitasia blattaphilus]